MAAIRKAIFFWNAFHNVTVVPCPRQFDALIFTPLFDLEKDRKKLKNGAKKQGNWIPFASTLFATKILHFSNIKAFLKPFWKTPLSLVAQPPPFLPGSFCLFLAEPLKG